MKLEPDQQIAILFLSVLVCGGTAAIITFLGTYTGTAVSALILTVIALIVGQLDDATHW